ncbi:MAG: PQQ-dependent dehydrogenase, methanol/ethanol family [Proteobacteria bacterium]|nr:PQQ-dependent dehydrogenase, methanol/ethanol family [Pseudomonadota bacterium]HQR02801.1 PQQ-dependent dehydrogenase, methanol/ethanol family [Rhodocyclaceae bacterium]
MMNILRRIRPALFALVATAATVAIAGPAAVDGARLGQADREPGNWMTHGRTYDEQRYSPLTQIDDKNVKRLGLAWSRELEFDRGMEATPLVIDGVMYVTGPWSIVYALDAVSGRQLWKYDPKVDRGLAGNFCCGPVNRGVAAWQGRIYVGVLDGRLVALDARNGHPVWSVQTTDKARPYASTGAPRVVKGRVLIGNGGAELGVRGYISAYDAASGKLDWRFYTVPGDPSKPFESKALEMAAKTWNGDQWWIWGGGGTVWDAMSYDPQLDLLYIGVGNGSTWPRALRSPGGGDNLFLSSIVALRPETGEYVWHYQLAPGEQWDYPATTQMILADMEIGGVMRHVLIQTPKHGFVYVLDRTNGKLLSAEKFTRVNWASGYDLATGRPIENPEADYSKNDKPFLQYPGPLGGHNWPAMSFNPRLGLIYFSETQHPNYYRLDPTARFEDHGRRWNISQDYSLMMKDPRMIAEVDQNTRGSLIAWNVAQGKPAWQVEQSLPANGATLATAGNLVFFGAADGNFIAYSADSGTRLWSFDTGVGVMGGPITYTVKGRQYVAVGSGWGGGIASAFKDISAVDQRRNTSRLLVFSLDAKGKVPPPVLLGRVNDTPPVKMVPEQIYRGGILFSTQCGMCHGSGAGGVPELSTMSARTRADFMGIVLGGLRADKGMPAFHEQLTVEDATAIKTFVEFVANMEKAATARKASAKSP